MFRLLALVYVILVSIVVYAEKHEHKVEVKPVPWCDSHREFVTTLEYMRKQDHYELGEQNSREIAKQVAKGCTGAAKRYVRVYELLKKVEAGARTSIGKATELSQLSDSHVSTFMSIFKNAYSQDELDLDINNSIKIASALSVDYSGDPKKAKEDYSKLVKFCLNQKKVGGSIPTCASIALDVAKSGENFKEPVADSFIKVYEFLRGQKELNFQISKAINEAKNITAIHPRAADNYIASFKYSVSKKGLAATAKQSINFANQMAKGTLPASQKVDQDNLRLPASKK